MSQPPAGRSSLDIAVYGIINAGKSSLINALTRRGDRVASPIGGTTVDLATVAWRAVSPDGVDEREADSDHLTIRLIDTPGLGEVEGEARGDLATVAAQRSDLVLFVAGEDVTATAGRAIAALHRFGKPIVVAVNKVDLLGPDELAEVLAAIRTNLAGLVDPADVVAVAAAPLVRRKVVRPDGGSRVETVRGEPEVAELEARLIALLAESGRDLMALADVLDRVGQHVATREGDRARRRAKAERAADESSAAMAVALAVNPIPLLDFLTGPAGLTFVVRRVAEAYDEPLTAEVARDLAAQLIRGGRAVMWGSLAGTLAGGAMKVLPGFGHLAGALTQGASAGYFGHVVGRALVEYFDHGHDWGDGGLVAALDRIAAATDRRTITKGLADRIKARLRGGPA